MSKAIPHSYGFKWEAVDVSRLCEHKGHVTMALTTPAAKLEIRVTPSGQFRIEQISGGKGAVKMEGGNG